MNEKHRQYSLEWPLSLSLSAPTQVLSMHFYNTSKTL